MKEVGKRLFADWVGKQVSVRTCGDAQVDGELAEVGDDGITVTFRGSTYFVPWSSFDYAYRPADG